MKKFSVLLSFMMTLLFVVPAQAQLRFGLSGGVSLNKVELNGNLVNQISRNYTGWYVGPTIELGIPLLPLKFDASVMYSYNGATIGEEGGEPHHLNGSYISVPVNAKLNIGLGSLLAVYLSAGPQFDYNVGSNTITLSDKSSFALKKSQFSANLGGGIRVFDQFQVGVYYNLPFGKTEEASLKTASFKNKTWKINLLVFF